MSFSWLLQQCPACLAGLIKWFKGRPYNFYFLGCCFHFIFNITRSFLVQFSSSFFSENFVSDHLVHPYTIIDTTAACKKLCLILSYWSDLHMINYLSI